MLLQTNHKINLSEGDAEFKEGTDLYFLHVTLPETEEKLNNLYKGMKEKIDNLENNSPELNDVNKLKLIESGFTFKV